MAMIYKEKGTIRKLDPDRYDDKSDKENSKRAFDKKTRKPVFIKTGDQIYCSGKDGKQFSVSRKEDIPKLSEIVKCDIFPGTWLKLVEKGLTGNGGIIEGDPKEWKKIAEELQRKLDENIEIAGEGEESVNNKNANDKAKADKVKPGAKD
jgi:hypothetical protein